MPQTLYEMRKESDRKGRSRHKDDKQEKIQVDVPAQLAISCPEIRNRVLANVEYFERKLAALEHAISRKTKTSQTSESDRQAEATDGRKWLRAAEKESSLARPLDFWTVKLEEARKEACTLQGDINGLLGDARTLIEKQREELTTSLKKSYGRASMRKEMVPRDGEATALPAIERWLRRLEAQEQLICEFERAAGGSARRQLEGEASTCR
uniref:Uncharacterized protein n=1 Tax=Hanusia phi TaxID=3032 RepID=A0A7S0E7K5_9CRYP|mmetsp:Transcript_17849/g.40431  ORF Transcript_17849/g.40431 Transcript_17849/m.40431 type:complete len:210 (+) Transcript_17849:455-1084(+)